MIKFNSNAFTKKNTTLIQPPEHLFNPGTLADRKNKTVSFYKKDKQIEKIKLSSNTNIPREKKVKTQPMLRVKKQRNTHKVQPDLVSQSNKLLEMSLKRQTSLVVKEDYNILEQNIKTREYMEDFLSIRKNFMNDRKKILYVLCDGHSGDQVAKIVVERLPEIFEQMLKLHKDDVETAITVSFQKMDEELVQYEETGSTCCLVYISEDYNERIIYSGNVGDSRTILIRQNEAIRISYDHKASDKSEIKRVKKEGGLILNKRLFGTLAITRALGDYSFKNDVNRLSHIPYFAKIFIEQTDRFIIIASDGIWDVINEEMAFSLIKGCSTQQPKDIGNLFVQTAIKDGSRDNISCIVIQLS